MLVTLMAAALLAPPDCEKCKAPQALVIAVPPLAVTVPLPQAPVAVTPVIPFVPTYPCWVAPYKYKYKFRRGRWKLKCAW